MRPAPPGPRRPRERHRSGPPPARRRPHERPRSGPPPGPPRPAARRVSARRGEPRRRLGISLLLIIFVLSLFAGRLVQLQGLESGSYRQLAQKQRFQPIALPAVRGTITGADGQPLAMTMQTFTIVADPKPPAMKAQDLPVVAQRLAGLLGVSAASVEYKLRHPTSPHYEVIARGVQSQTGEAISALHQRGELPGITPEPSYERVYPDGNASADVVGFTNSALTGVAGVEEEYNSLLAGHSGSEQVELGAGGVPIPLAGQKTTPAVNGSSIRLTIVPALQWAAQKACQQRVQQTHARNCTVVIIQPRTGHILAMAQWPTYSQTNPVNPSDLAVQDVFEPGSTAKPITAAAAFERGGQTPMTPYNIPYSIYRGGLVIHDAEHSPGERYTIAGVIANSSNVGMAQVVGHISAQTQHDYLSAFGLGQPSGVGLPGESPGILHPLSQYWGSLKYTLAYGQGVDVTSLQMASVYATIANGGVRVQPTLLEGVTGPSGRYVPSRPSPSRRVISATTARDLIAILQQVPAVDEQANQPWGIIPGYAVAAKTGTSNESGPNCPHTLCNYGSSFIGMAPGDNPQLVVAVNVQDPSHSRNDYFGDVVAGPVFYSVMKSALSILAIPPDGAVVPRVRLNAP